MITVTNELKSTKNEQYTIFMYSTIHLLKKDKIRFYYALKGRDGKTGIVKKCNIEQLGRTVLFVEAKHKTDVESFLKYWKCAYKLKDVLVVK